jgi:hypothetical protein
MLVDFEIVKERLRNGTKFLDRSNGLEAPGHVLGLEPTVVSIDDVSALWGELLTLSNKVLEYLNVHRFLIRLTTGISRRGAIVLRAAVGCMPS